MPMTVRGREKMRRVKIMNRVCSVPDIRVY